jgi:hypothetical protein
MLDMDSIIRKPIEISDGIELGLIVLPMNDYYRKVNGGAVYLTNAMMPLALQLNKRIKSQHWFDDQISLFRLCINRGNYRMKVFDDDFISWKLNQDANIWTGKGKAKFRQQFIDEVKKWKDA